MCATCQVFNDCQGIDEDAFQIAIIGVRRIHIAGTNRTYHDISSRVQSTTTEFSTHTHIQNNCMWQGSVYNGMFSDLTTEIQLRVSVRCLPL